MGFNRLGTVFCISGLCGSMVFHRQRKYRHAVGSLGPARAVMLIVISQLAVAYLIELLGIFGVERADFQWRKLLGMLICIAGVVIFKWK